MGRREAGGAGGAPAGWWARALAWALPLAGTWWVVTEGAPDSWTVGVPVVLLASAVAGLAMPWPRRWLSPLVLAGFLGWFLWQSLRGGWDVARRALAPSMPLAPGFVELRTTLPEGAGRVLLADVVSLLPGTLTVDVRGDLLVLHGLDVGPAFEAEFRDLERRIARLFHAEGAAG